MASDSFEVTLEEKAVTQDIALNNECQYGFKQGLWRITGLQTQKKL